MMGFAVVVTVVCRWSKDASVWEIGVVLVGRRAASGEGRRGARLCSDGKRERSSRGCRSSASGADVDGRRGGMVCKVWMVDESCKLQVPSARSRRLIGRLLFKTE